METIKIKVNKVTFEISFLRDKKQIFYSLARNKRTLINSSMPINRADEVKMNIYKDLSDCIAYEIRQEIEKLSNK